MAEEEVAKSEPECCGVVDNGVIPYILSPNCEKHLEWLEAVFDAKDKTVYRENGSEDGKILHARLRINGGSVYFSDGSCLPEQDAVSAMHSGESPKGTVLHLNVENPQRLWEKAMEHGAKPVVELKMQFWKSVYGSFYDPYGFEWALCSICQEHQQEGKQEDKQ